MLPLFTHLGGESYMAHYEPSSYVTENSTTLSLQEKFFNVLCQLSNSTTKMIVEVKTIPHFSDEFESLFRNSFGFLSLIDLKAGIKEIGERFLSRDDYVQRRANAFIRNQMANAEMILYGECRCMDSQLVDADQELLYKTDLNELLVQYNEVFDHQDQSVRASTEDVSSSVSGVSGDSWLSLGILLVSQNLTVDGQYHKLHQ
jgi:hypothetical protein